MPPSASSKAPSRARDGAGERALLVAEELAPGQRRDDRAAVQDHQPLLARPRVELVDELGHPLLAGAALAGDQHRGVGEPRHLDGVAEHRPPGRAVADQEVPDVAAVDAARRWSASGAAARRPAAPSPPGRDQREHVRGAGPEQSPSCRRRARRGRGGQRQDALGAAVGGRRGCSRPPRRRCRRRRSRRCAAGSGPASRGRSRTPDRRQAAHHRPDHGAPALRRPPTRHRPAWPMSSAGWPRGPPWSGGSPWAT